MFLPSCLLLPFPFQRRFWTIINHYGLQGPKMLGTLLGRTKTSLRETLKRDEMHPLGKRKKD